MKSIIPLVVVLAIAAGARAQQTLPKTPVFGSGVTLVAVPVFVTDKNGKSVGGLRAEDFEVKDGGKPAAIVSFQAIDVDRQVDDVPFADELPVAVQAASPRQFLILIDTLFSPRAGLYFGRTAATQFIRSGLAPGDLVAIATIGPSGLRILTNFTTDHENAARALDGKGLLTLGADPLGLRGGVAATGLLGATLVGDPGLAVSAAGGSKADAELAFLDALQGKAENEQMLTTISGYIDNMSTLVNALSPLRGRKQVVLLSRGFAEQTLFTTDGAFLAIKLQALYRQAGESDVVFHTVDLASITAPAGITDAGVDAPPVIHTDLNKGGGITPLLNHSPGRGTLISMAGATGGRAIPPTGNFNLALADMDRISRQSYVIAFEAEDTGVKVGKARSLEVKVRSPGLSVSHRKSYTLAATPTTTDAQAVQRQAAEAISKGLSGGRLGLQLTALPYQDGDGKESVHAVLHMDGPTLADAAQGSQLAVQVYGYAMRGGVVLDSIAMNTSLDLTRFGKSVRDSGIRIVTSFPASPGPVDLRFFVRAGASNITGSIQQTVSAPSFDGDDAALIVSKPMFMASPEGRVIVPFQPEGRPRIEIPFYVDDERFIPESPVMLSRGQTYEVCAFVWRSAGPSETPVEVAAEIVQRGHAPIPIHFDDTRVVAGDDGFDRYVFTLRTPDAPSGSSSLRMVFRDPSTSATAQSETTVIIEK